LPPEIIKVCGITSVGDALFAARNGATAIGLIFYPGSPRYVRTPAAAMISAALPRNVVRVGVFVDETPDRIRQVAGAARLDVAQLHGDESPEVCEALDGLRVWKAFHVGEDFDTKVLSEYPCEALFLDTASDGAYGGTGRTFPWPIAVEAKKHGRVIVAGGLDGDNVGEAIRKVDPYGVDASSKLEQLPGVKDPQKVQSYLEAATKAGG
jgi:phosphoribosylanthranilate isomerase